MIGIPTHKSTLGRTAQFAPLRSLAKHGQILAAPSGMSSDKPWWPCIRDVIADGIIANPTARYYMWLGDDHGPSGIYLATSNSLTSGWTYANSGDAIFTNTSASLSGSSVDSPRVLPNNDGDEYHLYCHSIGAGNTQSTQLLTGTDGENWTAFDNGEASDSDVVIDVVPAEVGGDGHTGYAHIFKIGNLWIAHHRVDGLNEKLEARSYSRDGKWWTTDYRVIGNQNQYLTGVFGDAVFRIMQVFQWNGQYWGLISYRPDFSDEDLQVLIAALDPDFRPIDQARVFLDLSSEGDDIQVGGQGDVLVQGGRVYYYYARRDNSGDGNRRIHVASFALEEL